jgi:hypothetical protein
VISCDFFEIIIIPFLKAGLSGFTKSLNNRKPRFHMVIDKVSESVIFIFLLALISYS